MAGRLPTFQTAMEHTERDVEEIDRLVRTLTSAERSASELTATTDAAGRPGSRWTNVTMRMPSHRAPGISRRLTRESEAVIDWLARRFEHTRANLSGLRRFIKMPSAVALVRCWVVLAIAYGGALSFWPYPKTYFWGLVLYQVCVGLSLVAGVWAARLCWEARLGAAHTLAIGAVLWAMTLGAVNTITAVRGEHWFETPTFAAATFTPVQRPAAPAHAPSKPNRMRPSSAASSPVSSS